MAWRQLVCDPSEDGLQGYVLTRDDLLQCLNAYEEETSTHFSWVNGNLLDKKCNVYLIIYSIKIGNVNQLNAPRHRCLTCVML